MKNLIFLDIDGVLNYQDFYKNRKKVKTRESDLEYFKSHVCPNRLGLINDLCKKIDAQVIISSTWRKHRTIAELQEMMDYVGATFQVIGKTPNIGYARGVEIKEWLHDNINLETAKCYSHEFNRYVIIDDDSDMLLNQAQNFFHVDGLYGLTPNTCYKIQLFFKQFKT